MFLIMRRDRCIIARTEQAKIMQSAGANLRDKYRRYDVFSSCAHAIKLFPLINNRYVCAHVRMCVGLATRGTNNNLLQNTSLSFIKYARSRWRAFSLSRKLLQKRPTTRGRKHECRCVLRWARNPFGSSHSCTGRTTSLYYGVHVHAVSILRPAIRK